MFNANAGASMLYAFAHETILCFATCSAPKSMHSNCDKMLSYVEKGIRETFFCFSNNAKYSNTWYADGIW